MAQHSTGYHFYNISELFAWECLEKNKTEESAACNKCKPVIKCKVLFTSGLIRHLDKKSNVEKPTETTKRPAEAVASTSNNRRPIQITSSFVTKKINVSRNCS